MIFFISDKLKITFMREAVIPPPMCGWEIEFSSSIRAVDFMSSDSSQLCVVTHMGHIHFFRLSESDSDDKSSHPDIKIICKEGGHFRPVWNYSASLDSINYSELYHWRLVNHSTMVACSMEKLMIFELNGSAFSTKYVASYL